LYTTSKFSVVGLSEAPRIELEPLGIGVSARCPGAVDTAIVDNTLSLTPGAPTKVHPKLAEAMAASQAFLKAGTSPDTVGQWSWTRSMPTSCTSRPTRSCMMHLRVARMRYSRHCPNTRTR
jgi:NAD(P)-dependent dehydrogenase (short-subunit alcohol dehydrogenase family)